MELRNTLSKARADSLYETKNPLLRRDMNDNATEYLVVGNKTTDRQVMIEYNLELPIAKRSLTGTVVLNQDGAEVDMDHRYSFTEPEIETVEWDSDIVGNDIRLIIQTSGLGENPSIIYRRTELPVA